VIRRLLELAGQRAEAADAVLATDETVTLQFEGGKLRDIAWSRQRGINLRVLVGGRVGMAGTTSEDVDGLLTTALSAAALGEELELQLPAPAPMAAVRTHSAAAAAASLADLTALGEGLVERLSGDGLSVNVTVERSTGSTRIANSRGVEATSESSSVALIAEVTRRVSGESQTVCDHRAGADRPGESVLAALAEGIRRRLAWGARPADPPGGEMPVLFTPSGSAPLLLPLRQACLGRAVFHGASPFRGRIGEQAFDSRLTVTDDPWVPGAVGSRAIDDEGVPTRRFPLVRRGVISGFSYDLETAARAGVPATGHARWGTFGRPRACWSNLVVAAGDQEWGALLRAMGDGVIVEELAGGGEGNVIGGAFASPVREAYRVAGGEVVGRISGAAVAGNAYELLGRIVGLGREVEWRGGTAVPPILVDGVSITPQ